MSKRRSPSLTQVAKSAGVSIATASRALNSTGRMTPETAARVLAAASELRYVPNPRFRAMGKSRNDRKQRIGTLGVCVPASKEAGMASDPYLGRMLWCLQEAGRERDYDITLTAIDADSPEYLPVCVKDMRVDGVIAAMIYDSALLERMHTLVPIVLFNTPGGEQVAISSIVPDNYAAIHSAWEHLTKLGHRRLAFFDIQDEFNWQHDERRRAFELLLERNKQRGVTGEAIVLKGRDKSLIDTAEDQLLSWQKRKSMPTALICAADVYAVAFLDAAHKLGIHVPGQLSVTGVDDTEASRFCRPKLTTIRHPMEVMANRAVELLHSQIVGGAEPTSTVTERFAVELIKRDSCGPAPKN